MADRGRQGHDKEGAIDFARVKELMEVREMFESLGQDLLLQGTGKVVTRCPVRCCRLEWCCQVDNDAGTWECNMCERHGGVLELCMAVWGLDTDTAAIRLCRLNGAKVPRLPRRRKNRRDEG